MTVDLKPRKRIAPYHSGSFSWAWMLDEGIGLPIGCSRGTSPGTTIYEPRKNGRGSWTAPCHNDGFPVSGPEAKAMARAAMGVVTRYRWIWKQYRAAPEETQRAMEKHLVREDFVDRAEEFAWFAFASGGFRVY